MAKKTKTKRTEATKPLTEDVRFMGIRLNWQEQERLKERMTEDGEWPGRITTWMKRKLGLKEE